VCTESIRLDSNLVSKLVTSRTIKKWKGYGSVVDKEIFLNFTLSNMKLVY